MQEYDYDTDGCSCEEIEWEPIDGFEGCPFCEDRDVIWVE